MENIKFALNKLKLNNAFTMPHQFYYQPIAGSVQSFEIEWNNDQNGSKSFQSEVHGSRFR